MRDPEFIYPDAGLCDHCGQPGPKAEFVCERDQYRSLCEDQQPAICRACMARAIQLIDAGADGFCLESDIQKLHLGPLP